MHHNFLFFTIQPRIQLPTQNIQWMLDSVILSNFFDCESRKTKNMTPALCFIASNYCPYTMEKSFGYNVFLRNIESHTSKLHKVDLVSLKFCPEIPHLNPLQNSLSQFSIALPPSYNVSTQFLLANTPNSTTNHV